MAVGRTDADKRALLDEVMDPQKVQLYCAQHFYFGPSSKAEVKPAKGCSRCWYVFYFHDIATTPPAQRAARMAELDEVLHKVVEMADRGKWDFEPYRHAKIEMESN